jgi:hypothetical protein
MAIEPAVVGFVWGAFLRLDRHARSTVPWDLQLRAVVQGMEATLEVGLDEALDAQLPVVALDQFVRSAVGKVVPSRRLALELAGEIIHCRGGVLELFGSLGKSAGIRLRMPQTSG